MGESRASGARYLVEVASEEIVRTLQPDFTLLKTLPVQGAIVTSRATAAGFDFVSRYFAPRAGIDEDPVTGSINCTLAPYWAARLGKRTLHAQQLSARGGDLRCEIAGDRVKIAGKARLYLQGMLEI